MSFLRNKNFWFYALITVIIIGGVFVRFWQLGTIPPGVHYDEAYNGMDALWANASHTWKIFYPDNTGREGLHINVIAFFINLFGNNTVGLRTANALWGSLTIVGFFFLLRALKFSKLSVAVGTFMIASSFWHIVFSRTAYRAIMVPLVLVWMLYFFWKAVYATDSRHRWCYFIISGLFLGLGFNTYIAFRIAPLIMVFIALSFLLTKRDFLKKSWKYGVFFAIAGFLIAMPIFVYYSDHFKDFLSRSEAVSIFNTPNMPFWKAFSTSLGKHLWAFFVIGDHNPRHNYNSQPLLPAAWSVLFAIGFIITVKEIGKTIYENIKRRKDSSAKPYVSKWFYSSVVAQSIFWVMLVPGVMSIEGIPHSLRIIGTIPAVFIISVLPLEYILSLYRELKNYPGLSKKHWQKSHFITIIAGLVAMIVFGGLSQIYIYFALWSKDVATQGAYERKLYDFGFLVKDLPLRANNYIITAFNTSITSDRRQSSLKTAEFIGYPNSQSYAFYKPMDGISQISCNDPQLVFLESDQWLRDQYRTRCPDLKAKRYSYDNGKFLFWVMNNNP